MEFIITEQALAEGLAKTLPHTARRDVTGVIESIRIDASPEGEVTFWATDRYTAVRYLFASDTGVFEVTTPGTVLIPAEQAKTLAKGKSPLPRRIKIEEGWVSIEGGSTVIRFQEGPGNFPPVERLFNMWKPATEATPTLIAPIHLAKFNGFKKEPLEFILGAEGSPIRVSGLNDRFEALIQPTSKKS